MSCTKQNFKIKLSKAGSPRALHQNERWLEDNITKQIFTLEPAFQPLLYLNKFNRFYLPTYQTDFIISSEENNLSINTIRTPLKQVSQRKYLSN